MRKTDTVTISLTPELVAEVDRLARHEGRTRSELLREAFRQYSLRLQRWDQLFAYGDDRATGGSLIEESVAASLRRRRHSRRPLAR
jgi:predicted transcriptional regulator